MPVLYSFPKKDALQNVLSLRDQFSNWSWGLPFRVQSVFSFVKETDSHTSDIGHWFGMTGFCILQRVRFVQKMTSHSGRAKHSMLMSCMLRGLPERRRLLSVVSIISGWRELI